MNFSREIQPSWTHSSISDFRQRVQFEDSDIFGGKRPEESSFQKYATDKLHIAAACSAVSKMGLGMFFLLGIVISHTRFA